MPIEGPRLQESCPLRGHWASFRLVDEQGNGEPYAGLSYTAYDGQGQAYTGTTDSTGFAKIDDFYKGPLLLDLSAPAQIIVDPWYSYLATREKFPIPLTALQIAAEHTPSAHRRPDDMSPAQICAKHENAIYFHVQVRDFVSKWHAAHLPDSILSEHRPPEARSSEFKRMFHELGKNDQPGLPLCPNMHHVLEVKALRAWRRLFSRDKTFSALNNYHLALMSTLSYAPFHYQRTDEQEPGIPPYENPGSIGNVLEQHLGQLKKPTLFNDATPYHLLCEEVPYSKRLEVLPYNPDRYVTERLDGWTFPESAHFLTNATDTQAYITHSDQVILISLRGTQEFADIGRDLDARQTEHEDGLGNAHRGFHTAFTSTKKYLRRYIDAFYKNKQTFLITGHSLGGAIALLVAEWIRRTYSDDVQLYTFGAPRAGDAVFVREAKDLTHHRIVNHNDPVPGVPFTWMDAEWKSALGATVMLVASKGTSLWSWGMLAGGLVNMKGADFEHHGEQRHFMPRKPGAGSEATLLWQPGCASIEKQTCALYAAEIQLLGDMPERRTFTGTVMSASEHSSNSGYSRAALANLLRWRVSVTERNGKLFSTKETEQLNEQIRDIEAQINVWVPRTFTEFYSQVRSSADPRFKGVSQLELQALFNDARGRIVALSLSEEKELKRARKRLKAQAERLISWRDVFGDQADREDLDALLSEWLQLIDVQKAAKLAKVQLGSDQQPG
ncbi:lipase family protein [Pseudomonas sp. G.S.17]|uniref:lipase family protein n=1 Tax=Pseudomonas sp. G.S.17 TaxID=3137451 RepID=UPI00311CDE35